MKKTIQSIAHTGVARSFAAFVCTAGLAASSGAAHADAAASPVPTITAVTANGTGCPAGTWDATIAPDGQSFTIKFDNYKAAAGTGSSISVKDCQVAVGVSAVSNASYALKNVSLEGAVALNAAGAKATLTAQAFFAGAPGAAQIFLNESFTGQQSTALSYDISLDDDDLLWSACGQERDINLTTRINARSPSGSGPAIIDLTAAQGQLSARLATRACN